MSESSSVPTEREQLLNRLATLAYRRGDFTLASGRKSEHYVNCKPVSLSGSGLALISRAMLTHVEADALAVAGLTLGADPLVSGVAMAAADRGRELDALIVRKEAKGHGTARHSYVKQSTLIFEVSGALLTALEKLRARLIRTPGSTCAFEIKTRNVLLVNVQT
jgi:hypothetical protein